LAKRGRKPQPVAVVYDGGRTVLSGVLWTERKFEVWRLDKKCCTKCGSWTAMPVYGLPNAAEVHHVFGRGMAGSKRDDRVWVEIDGKKVRNLVTRCQECHAKEKMQSSRPSKRETAENASTQPTGI
jgi:5-methylcytosine-specific restriction endonuclease McrA